MAFEWLLSEKLKELDLLDEDYADWLVEAKSWRSLIQVC